MDLFPPQDSASLQSERTTSTPLAARMRPQKLEDIVGQLHILAPGKLLRRAIETDRFTSIILHGPPGTGKTSLANVIAQVTHSHFVLLNGIDATVSEIKEQITFAKSRACLHKTSTILFVDELHRLNKTQQDVLLPHIENGTIRFIGATTENPFFSINGPLLSRSQVFPLELLNDKDLLILLNRALIDSKNGLGNFPIEADPIALEHIAIKADGDVRKALTSLEIAALSTPITPETGKIHITLDVAEQCIQKKALHYDRNGDNHYDTISAMIKSIRGSDPDAALYWLATMLEGGEDIRFIARRLVILASEDIGLADSNALRVALDAARAAEMIGLPEARIPLAHAAVYLATAPKSNSAYMGISAALDDVKNKVTLAVPAHLRTATRKKIAKAAGTSDEDLQYKYVHDFDGNYIPQAYLPEGRVYYKPSSNGLESRIAQRLDFWRSLWDKKNN